MLCLHLLAQNPAGEWDDLAELNSPDLPRVGDIIDLVGLAEHNPETSIKCDTTCFRVAQVVHQCQVKRIKPTAAMSRDYILVYVRPDPQWEENIK